MLHLDRVHSAGYTGSALRLSSSATTPSMSKVCNVTTASCIDIIQVSQAASYVNTKQLAEFEYYWAGADPTFAGAYLGTQGELSLVAGYDYFLTSTLFCWHNRSTPVPEDARALEVENGQLQFAPSSGVSPVECNHTAVRLFPVCSSVESHWLALD